MFKHYFEQVQNVEIWPIISLIIFLVFFTFTLVRILFMDKKHVERMKGMPLEEDTTDSQSDLKQ
jgi:cytochrome c oxidase cbb3-type subunit 4